jgi:hypothetical protein
MANRDLKKAAERGVVESFSRAYAQEMGEPLEIAEAGEAPDFVLHGATGQLVGAEVTTAYYDTNVAPRSLWNQLRGTGRPTGGTAVNPSDRLAENISARLHAKWTKSYGFRCLLLIHADAPLTTLPEFEHEIVPRLVVPLGPSPFEAVYVRISAANSTDIEFAWWELFPETRCFCLLARP